MSIYITIATNAGVNSRRRQMRANILTEGISLTADIHIDVPIVVHSAAECTKAHLKSTTEQVKNDSI